MSSPSLTHRLASWVELLRKHIAHHAGLNRALAPVVLILWGRLGRMMLRLASLESRWRSGTLRAPRLRAPRPRTPRPARATPAAPRLRLPAAQGWLPRLILHTGSFHDPIANLLADPDTLALLAAAPQAGRILRPLAHMFGISLPEVLRLPKRERKPRPPKPRKLRKPREDLSDLRPIAIRFIPPKDRARLRRLGLRFKTGP